MHLVTDEALFAEAGRRLAGAAPDAKEWGHFEGPMLNDALRERRVLISA